MDSLQLIILSLVQGLSEFLPISSSAHLILVSKLSGWPDQGITFDIAVHLGTLSAVLFHYRSALLFTNKQVHSKLFDKVNMIKMMVIGSLPLFCIGYLFEDIIISDLRDPIVIAVATIVFAVLLWFADSRHTGNDQSLSMSGILWIGFAQALALIPGTSRTGITLTAALLLGFSRTQSTNIAFLLAIPAIAGSSFYTIFKLSQLPTFDMWPVLILGFIIAAVVALLTIRLFIKLIEVIGLLPFVVYRLLLGSVLLLLYW